MSAAATFADDLFALLRLQREATNVMLPLRQRAAATRRLEKATTIFIRTYEPKPMPLSQRYMMMMSTPPQKTRKR